MSKRSEKEALEKQKNCLMLNFFNPFAGGRSTKIARVGCSFQTEASVFKNFNESFNTTNRLFVHMRELI